MFVRLKSIEMEHWVQGGLASNHMQTNLNDGFLLNIHKI